jgi:hypothetical protein
MRIQLLLLSLVLASGCGDSGTAADGERPVTELDGVPYGATCDIDADCGGGADSCCTGGKCSPDGWCSPRCTTDNDCPDGFYCIDHSGTRCFSACVDDRDCPTEFICEDKSGHKTCRYK